MAGGLILLLMLAQPAAQTATTYDDAVAMARRGEYTAALAAFERIVAAAPQDHDSRIWVGRLHGWLGNIPSAESTLRSVLLENPNHVEARVVLAGILLNRGLTADALDVLTPAETIAPADGEVLAALARARYFRGELSTAVAYIERATATSPTPEHLALREQILRAYRHRIELTGFAEHFTADIPTAGSGDIAINLRASDWLRVHGRGQVQDKFDTREWRAGGGLEWRLNGTTRVAGSLLVGPGTTVLPRTDANGEVGYGRGRVEGVAAVRRITFAAADVWVVSPVAYVTMSERVSVNGRYAFASTSLSSGPRVGSHSAAGGVSLLTGRRVWWSAGYARGTENFETLSPDRIGEFRADTVVGGVRVDLPNLSTVAAAYERQWRTRGTGMGRLTLTFLQRF